MTASTGRLNRLLDEDGKCLVVALDHGTTGEGRLFAGAEDLPAVLGVVARAGPDAVLLSLGEAHLLQGIAGRRKPSLLLRADVTSVYGEAGVGRAYCLLIDSCVEHAVRLDAAAVIANLFDAAGQVDIRGQCLANVARLRSDCDRFGMPLMVEARALRSMDPGGVYAPSGRVEHLVPIVRQAVEMGADLVKTDPTLNPEEFGRVVEAAGGKPVLALGGGRAADEEIVLRTHALIRQGARGLVYGRNVFAHPRPEAMIAALTAMLHSGAEPEAALSMARGGT